MIYTCKYMSPIGEITIAEESNKIVGAWFKDQKYFFGKVKGEVKEVSPESSSSLTQTVRWFDQYFNGDRPEVTYLPLDPIGSEFAKDVWKILCEIPYGKTTTYGEIAMKIAKSRGLDRMSAQAVGGAVGHNPISIIIPCHRVVGKDGSLTGYAGGLDKKTFLLEHEKSVAMYTAI